MVNRGEIVVKRVVDRGELRGAFGRQKTRQLLKIYFWQIIVLVPGGDRTDTCFCKGPAALSRVTTFATSAKEVSVELAMYSLSRESAPLSLCPEVYC